jgi:hypothetical protein
VKEERVQGTISVGDKTITIEGPPDFVREEIERLAGLSANVKHPSGQPEGARVLDAGHSIKSGISEEEFVAQKNPQGHSEIVAVLGYLLTESGRAEFSADDLQRAYRRAHVRPPKAVDQALRDAKNKFDYIEPGSKRGTFRLSSHGERTVVFDLPRRESETQQ